MQNKGNMNGQDGQKNDNVVQTYAAQLNEEERMLVLLQKELYDNSWQAMREDLNNRLNGRPYIFKLANRIKDDIARIDKLELFEKEQNAHLADYVKPPSQ